MLRLLRLSGRLVASCARASITSLEAHALFLAIGLALALGSASNARAQSLQRVSFESAPQILASGQVRPGIRIEGDLAKPEGRGPFPAIVGLHGCGGMHAATKRAFVNELVGWGYVVLLVDSHTTRGIEHACTSTAFLTFLARRADAYGGLAFLAGQPFVDAGRVAMVGFSAGGWVALNLSEANSFEHFVTPGRLKFRATIAFYPPCSRAVGRPGMPTLILVGALDDWTPASTCSEKLAGWPKEGPAVELVIYPGAHHSFYYPQMQPGRRAFDHWLEYNEDAARQANQQMRRFLDEHLR